MRNWFTVSRKRSFTGGKETPPVPPVLPISVDRWNEWIWGTPFTSIDDIPVAKVKIREIQAWFNSYADDVSSSSPVLIVSGPTGCCKSSLLKYLIARMDPGCDLLGSYEEGDGVDAALQSLRLPTTNRFNSITAFLEGNSQKAKLDTKEEQEKRKPLLQHYPKVIFMDNLGPQDLTDVLQRVQKFLKGPEHNNKLDSIGSDVRVRFVLALTSLSDGSSGEFGLEEYGIREFCRAVPRTSHIRLHRVTRAAQFRVYSNLALTPAKSFPMTGDLRADLIDLYLRDCCHGHTNPKIADDDPMSFSRLFGRDRPQSIFALAGHVLHGKGPLPDATVHSSQLSEYLQYNWSQFCLSRHSGTEDNTCNPYAKQFTKKKRDHQPAEAWLSLWRGLEVFSWADCFTWQVKVHLEHLLMLPQHSLAHHTIRSKQEQMMKRDDCDAKEKGIFVPLERPPRILNTKYGNSEGRFRQIRSLDDYLLEHLVQLKKQRDE